jgi:YesN/AraC family two-component response regulator
LNKGFVTKFESVLKQYFQSDKVKELGVLTVNYCARELNMSANYLGDLLKNETGINAKEHIQNFIVESAKTSILTTTKSISEIAYDFGFEYPQSFNKLFKSKTGYTPTQYRKGN